MPGSSSRTRPCTSCSRTHGIRTRAGLIDAVPSVAAPHRSRDFVLRGLLKRNELPKGCRFAPRCDFAEEACFEQRQVLRPIAPAHEAACRRLEEVEQLTAGRTSASSYVPLTGGGGRVAAGRRRVSRSRTTGARRRIGAPCGRSSWSSRTSRSTSAPARRSRSSANRGAASRLSRVPSGACCARSRASWRLRATTSPRRSRHAARTCVARSRSCSRIPMRRSTRASACTRSWAVRSSSSSGCAARRDEPASRRRSRTCASTRPSPAAIRTSSRAASGSGSRSPVRSRHGRG